MRDSQRGFTLVELMVAMAIGTIIILGAGHLFLTTFQTFQQVDEVSRKQETLIFAVSTLSKEGRRGDIAGSYQTVADERNSEEGSDYYCVLQEINKNQPVVDLAKVDGPDDCPTLLAAESNGVQTLALLIGDCRKDVEASCDEITFTVTNRNEAMSVQEAGS